MISGFLQLPAGNGAVYTVAVTVSDPTGASASVQFAWAVNQPPAGNFPAGVFHSGYSVKCLADPGGSTPSGSKLVTQACDGSAGQRWTLEADGTRRAPGRCLNISDSRSLSGTLVSLAGCAGQPDQQGALDGSTGSLYSPAPGRCLAIPGSVPAAGTQLEVPDCSPGTADNWQLQ